MNSQWGRLFICLALFLACEAVGGGGGFGSQRSSISEVLERYVGPVAVSRDTLSTAFEATLRAAQVPGGFVSVCECNPEPTYKYPSLGPKLGDALEAIRRVAPDYDFQVKEGIVDLVPAKGIPDLLQTRISEFDSKATNNLTWAASLLMDLPEVRAAKSKLGYAESPNQIEIGMSGIPGYGKPPVPSNPPFAVQCHHCEVYEILNALQSARGHGVWRYQERHCQGLKTWRIEFSD